MIADILSTPLRWAIAAVTVVLIVWAAWWFIIIRPAKLADAAAKAKAESAFSGARTESAKDATNITADAAKGALQDELTTRNNRDDILAQPGSQAPVDPRVSDAGRRAICLRDAARDRPECVRLLGPRSR